MAEYGATEMANAFRTVRKNTIQLAEDIPEDRYDFVPAPGLRSVSEQLRHILASFVMYYDFHRDQKITTLKGYDFPAVMTRIGAAEAVPRTKAQIIAQLNEEGEAFASWLESLSRETLAETFTDPMGQNPKTRLEQLLSAKEHEMHHRGQLMLIQRMIGVVPHLTRQREERMRGHAVSQPAAPVQ